MSVKEILAEINSLPNVGGVLLYTTTNRLIAKEILHSLNEDETDALFKTIGDLIRQFREGKRNFLEVTLFHRWNRLIASRYKNLIFLVLLYQGADTSLIKLHLDVAFHTLSQRKEIQKILSGEFTIVITLLKKIHVWDIIKFKEYLEREGFRRGIIISKMPYDKRVEDELKKQGDMIDIVISDNIKMESKNLTKRLRDQGYIVKKADIPTDRWL